MFHAWPAELLRQLIEQSSEGIVVGESRENDCPVVYANAAFEKLTGRNLEQLRGTDLNGLGGLRIEPLRDAEGRVTHLVGFQREPDERKPADTAASPISLPASGLPRWMREDRLSGLCSRAYFEELLRHDWDLALRENRAITLLMFDIDALGAYNDTFGRSAGDACIRRVAGVVAASFRRRSDVVARWDGGTLCALVFSTDVGATTVFAESVSQRVLEQHIHHPRALPSRFVSVRTAVVSLNPDRNREPVILVSAGLHALRRARAERNSRVVVATEADFRDGD